MKKKQVALLLAALMCITPMAESAAVMGTEFSSGEETVETVSYTHLTLPTKLEV